MTQLPSQGQVVHVKAQPDVYTVLLIVANLALLITIVVVLRHLMSETGYNLSIGDLFAPLEKLAGK